jgi:hypothetical protein
LYFSVGIGAGSDETGANGEIHGGGELEQLPYLVVRITGLDRLPACVLQYGAERPIAECPRQYPVRIQLRNGVIHRESKAMRPRVEGNVFVDGPVKGVVNAGVDIMLIGELIDILVLC